MTQKITVKQNPEAEVPIEVLAEAIKAIASGVQKLRSGKLRDRALFLLIQDAAGGYGTNRNKKRLSVRDIEAVFNGINSLESSFLRKPAP